MNKTYAFTDLHGMYDLWAQIKNYCDENDKLYFLGDAVDRGPAGLLIMKELLQDKRVTYLRGNHEDIFSIVAPELMAGHDENLSWWVGNGGYQTMLDFAELPLLSQEWYLRKINEMPTNLTYINKNNQEILLSHAGTTPNLSDKDYSARGEFGDRWLWGRKHISDKWPQDEKYKNQYIVHGHTPVQYLYYENDEKIPSKKDFHVVQYCSEHKFDLDLGSFSSKKIALFDLDELKVEKYFYTSI